MSKQRENIDAELAEWIRQQKIFFVATAPLAGDGHVNVSPKGGNAFRVLGPMEVAYHDYTGSGAETIAHLKENGRIVVMFCAFDGKPKICRLHGRGTVIERGDARFEEFAKMFPEHAGTRSFVRVQVERVSTSCGFGIPLMEFQEDRTHLEEWAAEKGPDGLRDYWVRKNSKSIDGMPALREKA